MKKLLLIYLIFLGLSCKKQIEKSDITQSPLAIISYNGSTRINAVVQDNNGNFYVGGYAIKSNQVGLKNAWVCKLNPSRKTIWQHENAGERDDLFLGIHFQNGNLFAVGLSYSQIKKPGSNPELEPDGLFSSFTETGNYMFQKYLIPNTVTNGFNKDVKSGITGDGQQLMLWGFSSNFKEPSGFYLGDSWLTLCNENGQTLQEANFTTPLLKKDSGNQIIYTEFGYYSLASSMDEKAYLLNKFNAIQQDSIQLTSKHIQYVNETNFDCFLYKNNGLPTVAHSTLINNQTELTIINYNESLMPIDEKKYALQGLPKQLKGVKKIDGYTYVFGSENKQSVQGSLAFPWIICFDPSLQKVWELAIPTEGSGEIIDCFKQKENVILFGNTRTTSGSEKSFSCLINNKGELVYE